MLFIRLQFIHSQCLNIGMDNEIMARMQGDNARVY